MFKFFEKNRMNIQSFYIGTQIFPLGKAGHETTELWPVRPHSFGAYISVSAYEAYTLENNYDIFSACLVLVFIPPNTQFYTSNACC